MTEQELQEIEAMLEYLHIPGIPTAVGRVRALIAEVRRLREAISEAGITLRSCRYSEMPMAMKLQAILDGDDADAAYRKGLVDYCGFPPYNARLK